ncbi:MAG: hypothetical protein IK114_08900 [Fibrobacter sp.]|nr:hypothetical protein [Fibrobacter sp.]
MGWYKEYLQDKWEIEQENARAAEETDREIRRAVFVTCCAGLILFLCGLHILPLILGIPLFIIAFFLSVYFLYKLDCDVITFLSIGFYFLLFPVSYNEYVSYNEDVVLEKDSKNMVAPPPKKSSSKKISFYLQGVDDIEDADELRKFYYKIASDFYNNEMGLKGSPEQIDAGNKVMSDVYGFLGLSLSKGELQNVDSIKAVIQNNAVISGYRKKKAIEELDLGIEKIGSIQ